MEISVEEGYKSKSAEKPILIRYADDFVLFHLDEKKLQRAVEAIKKHLTDMGLELKPSKTRWTHTLTPYQGDGGFDFLGFHVRQHPVGKNRTGKDTHGRKLGFKTIITPSPEAIKRHTHEIKAFVHTLRPAKVGQYPIQRYETNPGEQMQFDWGRVPLREGGKRSQTLWFCCYPLVFSYKIYHICEAV
jgi:RNA-directed DNA polymerase